MTGYAAGSISEWINAGKLQAVWYFNQYQIPKIALIECFMAFKSENRRYYAQPHLAMIQKMPP